MNMPDNPMSKRTADLMLLLFDDGVDPDELKALIGSAFVDGVDYSFKHMDETRDNPDR